MRGSTADESWSDERNMPNYMGMVMGNHLYDLGAKVIYIFSCAVFTEIRNTKPLSLFFPLWKKPYIGKLARSSLFWTSKTVQNSASLLRQLCQTMSWRYSSWNVLNLKIKRSEICCMIMQITSDLSEQDSAGHHVSENLSILFLFPSPENYARNTHLHSRYVCDLSAGFQKHLTLSLYGR